MQAGGVGFTGGAPVGSQHYAQGALPQLTPRLLQLMERQDEHDDPSEWNVSKAGCCCLEGGKTVQREACHSIYREQIIGGQSVGYCQGGSGGVPGYR